MNMSLNDSVDFNETGREAYAKIYISRDVSLLLIGSMGAAINVCNLLVAGFVPGTLSPHLRLVLSLTLADLFVCVTSVTEREVMRYLVNGRIEVTIETFKLVKVLFIARFAAYDATLFSMIGISINMCLCIRKPLQYERIVTARRASVFIFLIWLLVVALGTGSYLHNSETSTVYTSHVDAIILSSGIFVCFVILVVSYATICFEVINIRRRSFDLSGERPSRRRTVVTTTVVIVTYITCWFLWPVQYYLPHTMSLEFPLTEAVILSNTVIDAFVYALRLSKFRDRYQSAFKTVTKCCTCAATCPKYCKRVRGAQVQQEPTENEQGLSFS